ncbi:MAG: phosphate ABC transporter substrate-binding protein, PhoT family, partial [Bacteroidota bacterium]
KFGLQKLPANFFATNGFSELVDYVASHKNSIGVISNNNLLNNTDSVLQKNVRVVSIMGHDGITYFPSDSNIRSGNYPFRREVYIACGESWPGLGTGFAKFMTTDIGQTIIKRSGLIPSRQAMRNIELKKDF